VDRAARRRARAHHARAHRARGAARRPLQARGRAGVYLRPAVLRGQRRRRRQGAVRNARDQGRGRLADQRQEDLRLAFRSCELLRRAVH
jgi:hypothetical protein